MNYLASQALNKFEQLIEMVIKMIIIVKIRKMPQ